MAAIEGVWPMIGLGFLLKAASGGLVRSLAPIAISLAVAIVASLGFVVIDMAKGNGVLQAKAAAGYAAAAAEREISDRLVASIEAGNEVLREGYTAVDKARARARLLKAARLTAPAAPGVCVPGCRVLGEADESPDSD